MTFKLRLVVFSDCFKFSLTNSRYGFCFTVMAQLFMIRDYYGSAKSRDLGEAPLIGIGVPCWILRRSDITMNMLLLSISKNCQWLACCVLSGLVCQENNVKGSICCNFYHFENWLHTFCLYTMHPCFETTPLKKI